MLLSWPTTDPMHELMVGCVIHILYIIPMCVDVHVVKLHPSGLCLYSRHLSYAMLYRQLVCYYCTCVSTCMYANILSD